MKRFTVLTSRSESSLINSTMYLQTAGMTPAAPLAESQGVKFESTCERKRKKRSALGAVTTRPPAALTSLTA